MSKVLYRVKQNFEETKERLGVELFNRLYTNETPKEFDVIEEYGDEICTLQPFSFGDGSTKLLSIWSKSSQYTKL